ncbi:hypothetical protein, partial [Aquitalea sp. LB_tupeE]|uniref:hypothetical protein n=1 Tax=Aquitalea sp. LB_tupeE TaxID=2748078 RepID=UPI001C4CC828
TDQSMRHAQAKTGLRSADGYFNSLLENAKKIKANANRGSRPAVEVLCFCFATSPLRQKKVPKEKATRSASNSRPSHATQGAAGTCGALTSRRFGQPTA